MLHNNDIYHRPCSLQHWDVMDIWSNSDTSYIIMSWLIFGLSTVISIVLILVWVNYWSSAHIMYVLLSYSPKIIGTQGYFMCSCKCIYVHAFGYETFILNMRYMHIFLKIKSSLYTYCSCYFAIPSWISNNYVSCWFNLYKENRYIYVVPAKLFFI